MTSREKKAHQRMQAKIKEAQAFIEKLKKSGVKASVQLYTPSGGACHLTSMTPAQALGTLYLGQVITICGIQAGQSFDSFVQSMEKRPDLVARFKNLLMR